MALSNHESVESEKKSPQSDEYVQSFARGLGVIKAFGAESRALTLSEVAEESGLSRAAARRILLTLVHLGYVGQNGRQFFLLPRVLELGYAYLSALGVPELAQPVLNQVAAEVGESCSMSVLDGNDIVYIARVPTRKIITISLGVGTRLPAYATSMGRVLLGGYQPAQLERYLAQGAFPALTVKTLTDPGMLAARIAADRAQGYALIDEELETGLCSLAVPIRNQSGQIVAAMNVSASRASTSPDDMVRRLLPPLRNAAETLSQVLGHRLPAVVSLMPLADGAQP